MHMRPMHLTLAMVISIAASSVRAATCPASTIGLDPTASDTVIVEYLSRCVGQVFTVPDTLLEALTIWRPAVPALNSAPRHLFIVDVDSTGRPIPYSIIVDGGALVNFVGDGIHPVPYRFEFDPPVMLPHRGQFCFVVSFETCGGAISILGSDGDPYSGGQTWQVRTDSFANCVYPVGYPSPMNPLIDIVFRADFCETSTPTRQHSWGELKASYH